jgi:acyl carrier protein
MKEDTVEKVMRIISVDYDIDLNEITPDSLLMDGRSLAEQERDGPIRTLGLDSLDYLELIMRLETAFGIEIDPESEELQRITTPAKAAEEIDRLLGRV